MQTENKILIIASVILISLFGLMVHSDMNGNGRLGSGNPLSNINSVASSAAVTIPVTSYQVTATNTARVYMEIQNLTARPVFCNLRNGAAASVNSGLTIFASSSRVFTQDTFPYTGALTCIGEVATLVTFIEK